MPRKKTKPEPKTRVPAARGSAREIYEREKARRADRGRPTVDGRDLMAEAEAEFKALLESEALAGRGGRPKKMVTARAKRGTRVGSSGTNAGAE
jgi:hypothetical protein